MAGDEGLHEDPTTAVRLGLSGLASTSPKNVALTARRWARLSAMAIRSPAVPVRSCRARRQRSSTLALKRFATGLGVPHPAPTPIEV